MVLNQETEQRFFDSILSILKRAGRPVDDVEIAMGIHAAGFLPYSAPRHLYRAVRENLRILARAERVAFLGQEIGWILLDASPAPAAAAKQSIPDAVLELLRTIGPMTTTELRFRLQGGAYAKTTIRSKLCTLKKRGLVNQSSPRGPWFAVEQKEEVA